MTVAVLVLVAGLLAAPVAAQVVPAPEKRGGEAVQHGAQPNADEVRPGNRDGDVPSASAGDLVTKPGRRLLGLPLTAVLAIAGLLVALTILAKVVIPVPGRRRPAPGGGTSGGSERSSRP
jgi:hypothetical protein